MHAGERSSFYTSLSQIDPLGRIATIQERTRCVMQGFIDYVQNGLTEGASVYRKAQMDVVSDLLHQARTLLDSGDMHPAAPAMIVGAALEEFLRNWIEEFNLDLGEQRPGLETYAKVLRQANLIDKQDVKDIISWSGLRNHAAHGEWAQVNSGDRVAMMLEGVNLFMRKYGDHEKQPASEDAH